MRYTRVNANAERLQDARREELLGKDVRELYPDDESRKTIALYERVIREQVPLTSRSYHAGFNRWVKVRAFPTPQGVSVFYRDVTEEVRSEEALRESGMRFRLALRNAPVSVAAQDRDLRYIWAFNQRTARPEEIIGRTDADVFTAQEAARRVYSCPDPGGRLRARGWDRRDPSGCGISQTAPQRPGASSRKPGRKRASTHRAGGHASCIPPWLEPPARRRGVPCVLPAS